MKGTLLHEPTIWKPLESLGLTHKFFSFELDVLINTWIALGILFALALLIRYALSRPHNLGRFLITSSLSSAMDFVEQTLNNFSFNHFVFVGAIFIFILFCNLTAIIPFGPHFMVEPTSNLNTTLALGIASFIYVQSYTIYEHGFVEYAKEFTTPFFLMAPLHVVGKLATIISISFRLFGNIFGGSIISEIWFGFLGKSIFFELGGILTGVNFIVLGFFGMFEAFLQAFVFTMLTLTYLSIGIQHEEETPKGKSSC